MSDYSTDIKVEIMAQLEICTAHLLCSPMKSKSEHILISKLIKTIAFINTTWKLY